MRSVLVTGATTGPGAAVVRALLAHPAVERVLAVGAEPGGGALLGAHERLEYVRVDLRRPREIRELLWGPARRMGVDAVVHAALHRRATDAGEAVHVLNVEATRELVSLCERHPTVRRFVFRGHAEVYKVRAELPALIDETQALELSPSAPQWVRDRVEADLAVCARAGLSAMSIAVLRCAECLAPAAGSQLWDYLHAPVCFRPLGFDPMLNLLSVQDLARAVVRALASNAVGVFNVAGADTLPLSEAIARWGRVGVPVPGPLLGPLYALRARLRGTDFRYDLNHWRFHFSGVLDGRRAREVLGYVPRHPIPWPRRPTMF